MEKLTIQYRFQDYFDANKVHYNQNKWVGLGVKIYCFIGFNLAFLKIILDYVYLDKIAIAIVPFAISCMFIGNYEIILKWLAKISFKTQKKSFEAPVTVIFEETKITYIDSFSESKFSWFFKHHKTPKMLLIYVSPLNFIMIPKKYCATEEQYENICNIVTNFPQGD